MKCTKIILGGLMAVAATVNAMPTLEQTKKVEPLVMDLMREDQNALKSGKKTRAEVAESAMALAEKAETEAAKLLLMKGAFHLYVRAGEFDRAIETLQRLQSAIPDMPLDNMVRIIESSLRVVSRKNGGQLYRLLDETKTRIRYTNETASLEKSVKRTPFDRALRLKLAEHYAYLGKWDLALESFAATDGKAGTFAKSERDGKAATEKAADFWWNYPTGKADELVKCFRAHAVNLYEEAIASGDIKGLNKVQAERRIEEAKGYKDNIFGVVESASKRSASAKSTAGVKQGAHCAKVQLWEGGPYWADVNIGAKKPWECGYYFWWGDTIGYKRENDAWVASDGSSSGFQFGEAITPTYDRPLEILQNERWITTDNVLVPEHDAARAHLGGEWRLPTQQELEELKNKCDWKWTTMKGVNGYVVCGRGTYASASIFLPAAGEGYGNGLNDADSQGQYWASVPNAGKFCSWRLNLNSGDYGMGKGGRSYGRTIRPVYGVIKSTATR